MAGWMNGNDEGYESSCTRWSKYISLEPATNRNTQCYWVKIMHVSILFSYRTAMAFSVPGEGGWRRKDSISRTTANHLRETGADCWSALEDAEFERALDRAIMGSIVKDRRLLEGIYAEAVAAKLVPELA